MYKRPEHRNGWRQQLSHWPKDVCAVAAHTTRRRPPRGHEILKQVSRGVGYSHIEETDYQWDVREGQRTLFSIVQGANGVFQTKPTNELRGFRHYFPNLTINQAIGRGLELRTEHLKMLEKLNPAAPQAPEAHGPEIEVVRSFGYSVEPWDKFAADPLLPAGLLDRATETKRRLVAEGEPVTHVLYDTSSDDQGFMIMGADPRELSMEAIQHLELPEVDAATPSP